MVGPPVYEDGLFELSIDPCLNSLDNTFKTYYNWSHKQSFCQTINADKALDDYFYKK